MDSLLWAQRVVLFTAGLACLVRGTQAQIEKKLPTAHAGPDQTVALGTPVTLTGSASTDPHGHSLTFLWTLASKPAASRAVLANATSLNPAFIPDEPGSY